MLGNIVSIVIVAVIAAVVALMVFGLVRDKKAGRSSCGGGCAGCAMAGKCHGADSQKDKK